MAYNFEIVSTTDSDQAIVTYYTITDLRPFSIFNFTIYNTNILMKIKSQDDIIFSQLNEML